MPTIPTPRTIPLKSLAATVLLTLLTTLTVAKPASAQSNYRIWNTAGRGVSIRVDAPATSASRVNGPPEGEKNLTVECQTTGDTIEGSNIWDRIVWNGIRGFIPDAYLYTGHNAFDPRLLLCPQIRTNGVTIRTGPSALYSWVSTQSTGAQVTLRCWIDTMPYPYGPSRSTRWFDVTVNSKRGYLMADNVSNQMPVPPCTTSTACGSPWVSNVAWDVQEITINGTTLAGITLRLTPTTKARSLNFLSMSTVLSPAVLVSKFTTIQLNADTIWQDAITCANNASGGTFGQLTARLDWTQWQSMRNQHYCHAVYVPLTGKGGPTWDYESWRPNLLLAEALKPRGLKPLGGDTCNW
jgi:hypothetical protein